MRGGVVGNKFGDWTAFLSLYEALRWMYRRGQLTRLPRPGHRGFLRILFKLFLQLKLDWVLRDTMARISNKVVVGAGCVLLESPFSLNAWIYQVNSTLVRVQTLQNLAYTIENPCPWIRNGFVFLFVCFAQSLFELLDDAHKGEEPLIGGRTPQDLGTKITTLV